MLAPRLAGSGQMQPVCRRREELVVGLRCGFPKLLSEVLGRCTTFVSPNTFLTALPAGYIPHVAILPVLHLISIRVALYYNVYNLRISPKAASGLLEYCFAPNAELL